MSHAARLTSSILLCTICIFFPARVHAEVCHPPLGCPPVQSPRLTKTLAIQLIEGYLEQHPPLLQFLLNKPIATTPPAAYLDLARAGFLRTLYGKPGAGSGPVYGLPDNWQHDITSGFLRFTQVPTGEDTQTFIEILVGHFRYIAGSAVLMPPNAYSQHPSVTFRYRFVGNANAARLLELGPTKDWPDLRQLGRVVKGRLFLRTCHAGWIAGKSPLVGPCA